jgi:6-phosphogluconolactonase (cycloisomerase 2 family)
MTQTAVSANSSTTSNGSILPYSVSGTTLTSMTPVSTGGWPISIAFDPNGTHGFVPNYGSASVSVFSVGTNGALSPLNLNNGSNILPVGTNPIAVIVR